LGGWGRLVGSVVAHRMFGSFPVTALVVWVVIAAGLPHWAITSIVIVLALSSAVLALTVLAARRHQSTVRSELGTIRNLLVQARIGLAIMRRPVPAATAAAFQSLGWLCQLFAGWTSMRAFNIHQALTVPAVLR